MKPPLSSSSSTLHHHQQQQQFLSPNYLPSSTNHLSPYSPFIFTPSSPSSFASNWHQEHQDQHQIPAESWSQLLILSGGVVLLDIGPEKEFDEASSFSSIPSFDISSSSVEDCDC